MQTPASLLADLHTASHTQILDAIDEVRRQGTGEYVSLPQIVVCGDQSSGKSAVLEAISGVRFPVKTGTCTRFATELCLRRGPKRSGSVRINPGPTASEHHKEHLKGFQVQNVSIDEVGTYIEQAKAYMEISETKKFSDDKLLVEVKGPEFQPLTLIDLPGLIHSVVRNDNDFVRELASGYLGEKRSVILAIVHAKTDIDNQEILNLIKEKDPAGKRTIGVITKPDKIEDNDTDQFSLLARNEKYRLQRGWHVVRNRSSGEDPSSFDQEKEEAAVFQNEPWKGLLPAQLGIARLRARLSKVLLEETCNSLEKVMTEVELQIADCGAQLKKLGPTRASPDDQRKFLTEIRENFREHVYGGVEGHYTNPYYEKNVDQRLRATIRRLNDEFDQNMHNYGHTFHIEDITEKPANDSATPLPVPPEISARAFLHDIDQTVVQTGRAQELPGRYNADLVATVFRKQSIKWQAIARNHAAKSFSEAKKFLRRILYDITEPQNADRLWNGLVQPQLLKRQDALEQKVDELLKPYIVFIPHSTPRRYARGLSRFTKVRNKLEIAGQGQQNIKDYAACADLLLAMLAYYDSALETFIDNMISLAVENCLLCDLSNLIAPDVFATMTNEELSMYTEEPEEVVTARKEATKKLGRLEQSLETFRQQVWNAKTSIVAPIRSSFSFGLAPGDNSIDELASLLNSIQLQVPEEPLNSGLFTPKSTQSRQNEGTGRYQSANKTPSPPARPSSTSAVPATAAPSSPNLFAPQPSLFQAASDTLAPGIMYPSPSSSSTSPNSRDWRRRRPSSRSPKPPPVQAVSDSDTGKSHPWQEEKWKLTLDC
jgi:Dynamin family/Dynamin central region